MRFLLVTYMILLTACSAVEDPLNSLSSTGFAIGPAPSNPLDGGQTLTAYTAGTASGDTRGVHPHVTLTQHSTDRRVSIAIDGEVVRLRDSVTTPRGFFAGSSQNGLVLFEEMQSGTAFSRIARIRRGGGPEDFDVFAVYGLETDPATLAVREAMATYNGVLFLTGKQENGSYETREGTLNADVNFAASSLSGRVEIGDATAQYGDFSMTAFGADFADGEIVGNTFSANLDIPQDALGANVPGGLAMTGRFYGTTGNEIAGTLSGSGRRGNGAAMQDVGFSGAFAAQE